MQSFAIDRGSVTILNVDDETESRRTTTRVLARAGYRVVEAPVASKPSPSYGTACRSSCCSTSIGRT